MIDMEKNMLFISDERIKRLQAKLDSVLFQIKSDKYHTCKSIGISDWTDHFTAKRHWLQSMAQN